MITPPCKGCTRRTKDCHAHCEEYGAFRKRVEGMRELKNKENVNWPSVKRKSRDFKNNAVLKCHKK